MFLNKKTKPTKTTKVAASLKKAKRHDKPKYNRAIKALKNNADPENFYGILEEKVGARRSKADVAQARLFTEVQWFDEKGDDDKWVKRWNDGLKGKIAGYSKVVKNKHIYLRVELPLLEENRNERYRDTAVTRKRGATSADRESVERRGPLVPKRDIVEESGEESGSGSGEEGCCDEGEEGGEEEEASDHPSDWDSAECPEPRRGKHHHRSVSRAPHRDRKQGKEGKGLVDSSAKKRKIQDDYTKFTVKQLESHYQSLPTHIGDLKTLWLMQAVLGELCQRHINQSTVVCFNYLFLFFNGLFL